MPSAATLRNRVSQARTSIEGVERDRRRLEHELDGLDLIDEDDDDDADYYLSRYLRLIRLIEREAELHQRIYDDVQALRQMSC